MKAYQEIHQRFYKRKSYRKSRWNKARRRFIKRIGCNWTEKIGPFPPQKEEKEETIQALDKEVTRGKRSVLFGEVCEEGIVWTNIKTGTKTLERYEEK